MPIYKPFEVKCIREQPCKWLSDSFTNSKRNRGETEIILEISAPATANRRAQILVPNPSHSDRDLLLCAAANPSALPRPSNGEKSQTTREKFSAGKQKIQRDKILIVISQTIAFHTPPVRRCQIIFWQEQSVVKEMALNRIKEKKKTKPHH